MQLSNGLSIRLLSCCLYSLYVSLFQLTSIANYIPHQRFDRTRVFGWKKESSHPPNCDYMVASLLSRMTLEHEVFYLSFRHFLLTISGFLYRRITYFILFFLSVCFFWIAPVNRGGQLRWVSSRTGATAPSADPQPCHGSSNPSFVLTKFVQNNPTW